MASMYAQLLKESKVGSLTTKKIADFDETDPYHFVVKEAGEVIAEGSLTRIKLKLDESYFYRKIKTFTKDPVTLIATIEF